MYKKYILIIILILGVFVMPSNFFRNMTKNVVDHIRYRGTLVTGEITTDNEDGTYDVKINNASSAYKDVETVTYEAIFSVGEIVVIGYEYGNKESPKILGHSKKIPQEPKQVEVDYSGGCAGVQTKTVTIYSEAADGDLGHVDASYSVAHNIATSDSKDDTSYFHIVGQEFAVTQYEIDRAFLYFDLSSIPSNVKITNAILKIRIELKPSVDFILVAQDGQPNYPHNPLQNSDFNCNHYKNNGGQVNTSTMTEEAYVSIPFNSNGKNWVNPGGIMKLCLRNASDIANVAPTEEELLYFYAFEKGEGYKPKLTITYEI